MPKKPSGKAVFWGVLAAAFAVGVAVEIGHRGEAWDSPSYWSIGLPAMILAAFVCGFVARRGQMLVGYAPFLGQLLTMVAKTGSGNMLPMGLVLMGVIGLGGVAAACVGAFLGKQALE